jgi:hypothetical protein
VLWLIPILLTTHNAEEALAFQAYLPRMRALLPTRLGNLEASLSYSAMLGALAVLSALAFLLTVAAVARPSSRRLLWALLALEAAVAVNVIAHLVSAVVVFHGYGPGLVTAVTINAPFAFYCFRRARREQWVSAAALRATVPASLVLHGPMLLGGLWLAGRISR